MNPNAPNRFKVALEYFRSPGHHPQVIKEYVSQVNHDDDWSSGGNGTVEALGKFDFDGGAIRIGAVMESGCRPLFTIRFASRPLDRRASVAVVSDPGNIVNRNCEVTPKGVEYGFIL